MADMKSCIVDVFCKGRTEQCPDSLNLAFVKWTIIVM